MPDIYMKVDPVPNKDKKGVNLDIGICFEVKGKGEKCEMVDRLKFDQRDVERGIPQQVQAMLGKSVSGQYWEQGCKRLNMPIKDGKCGKAVSGKSFYTYTPKPVEKKIEAKKPETKQSGKKK